MLRSVITGSGSYIPSVIKSNLEFAQQEFYAADHQRNTTPSQDIVKKFQQITGIAERRYAAKDLNASDIGAMAAQLAIDDSGIDPETLDQIIVAHNFGNVAPDSHQTVAVPSLACLIKHRLGIRNPKCVAYDILFGCPGWLQGVIQADAFFKAGIAGKALIIGTETLSRVMDPFDRDSMIYSDGAGAIVLESRTSTENGPGILNTATETHSMEEVDYINMDASFYNGTDPHIRYLKMKGRKVYEFAISQVPNAMKSCLDASGVQIHQLKKIFIHQANEKMDEAILTRLFKLYDITEMPERIMPMCIHWLGNSSVATIPSLFDLVRKGQLKDQSITEGDVILFASVGAGMNINAVCYRC
jgi:3-oxoacyl-[acyl-carrier-protein] synthase III